VLILIGLILMGAGCSQYNSMVTMEEDVANAWSKVESAYQRRADLIPNLVETVKGVAEFERETFTSITEARSKVSSLNIDASKLNADQIQAFQEAQGSLSQSLGRLMLVAENYPELKASQNFRELQAQLEGTENRIKVERDRFNDAVTAYNKKIRQFPASLFAGVFGFDRMAMFEAEEGAQNAPKVEF
jgi:LemA protein